MGQGNLEEKKKNFHCPYPEMLLPGYFAVNVSQRLFESTDNRSHTKHMVQLRSLGVFRIQIIFLHSRFC